MDTWPSAVCALVALLSVDLTAGVSLRALTSDVVNFVELFWCDYVTFSESSASQLLCSALFNALCRIVYAPWLSDVTFLTVVKQSRVSDLTRFSFHLPCTRVVNNVFFFLEILIAVFAVRYKSSPASRRVHLARPFIWRRRDTRFCWSDVRLLLLYACVIPCYWSHCKLRVPKKSRGGVGIQGGSRKVSCILWWKFQQNGTILQKFFHCYTQQKVCNKEVITDVTVPKKCHYTTLQNS